MKLYTWRKGFFSSSTQIFVDLKLAGYINPNSLKDEVECGLNSTHYVIKSRSLFSNQLDVTPLHSLEQLATIKYNPWRSKATISVGDKVYYWSYTNAWETKWQIVGYNGDFISYKGSIEQGFIEANTSDEFLVIAGLALANRNRHFFYFIAVFIPLFLTLFLNN